MFAPFRPRQSKFSPDRLPEDGEIAELSPVVRRSILAAVRDLDRRFSRVRASADRDSSSKVPGSSDEDPNPSWHGIF